MSSLKQSSLLLWQSTSDEVMEWPAEVPRQPKRKRPYCKVHYLKKSEATPPPPVEEPAPEPPSKDLTVSLPQNALMYCGLPDDICSIVLDMAYQEYPSQIVDSTGCDWEGLLKHASFVSVETHQRFDSGDGLIKLFFAWENLMNPLFREILSTFRRGSSFGYAYTTRNGRVWNRSVIDLVEFGIQRRRDIFNSIYTGRDHNGYGFCNENCYTENREGFYKYLN